MDRCSVDADFEDMQAVEAVLSNRNRSVHPFWIGYHRLWCAVIEANLKDWTWICGPDCGLYCQALGIDQQWFKRMLREKHLREVKNLLGI